MIAQSGPDSSIQKISQATVRDKIWFMTRVDVAADGTVHCKNKIVKINLLVTTFARNNLNCNLIGCVCYYPYTVIIIE